MTFQNRKHQSLMGSLINSSRPLKGEIISSLHNLLKIETEQILSDFFYEVSITLIPKPHKHIKRKLQTNIS